MQQKRGGATRWRFTALCHDFAKELDVTAALNSCSLISLSLISLLKLIKQKKKLIKQICRVGENS